MCFLASGTVKNQEPKFTITATKLYVLVVNLLAQINVKLLKQLESGFIWKINWNKYQYKVTQQALNKNLDLLIDSSFQGVNRLFILSFKDRRVWESYKQHFLPTVEIKDYNVPVGGKTFFDQSIKNNLRTNDHIRKIAIGQTGYYTTGCLIDYPCFKNCYKLIAIDLSKQQKLGVDLKAIQKISFTGNVDRGGITQMFSVIEEPKEAVLDFPEEKMELKKL